MHFVKLALLSLAALASAGNDKDKDKDKGKDDDEEVVHSKDAGGILAEDIKGRVDITRTFSGKELNIEYLFGTFSSLIPATQFQLLSRPVNYTIAQFASTGNVASTSVIINFQDVLTGALTPRQIDAYTSYNSEGQIQQYDAIFRRYPWYSQTAVLGKASGILYLYRGLTGTALLPSAANINTALQALLANSICQTHTLSCSAYPQYASQTECFNHLTQNVPLGEAWAAGQNNVICRAIHQNMVPLRPEVHCDHIGKTGGHACTNDRYSSVFEPFYEHSWNALADDKKEK
ncbi:hypothetical protein HDU86_006766 [Geranomyces michiganensis]|nr:hypothetical protein HDU86_006766 [Geranomyces michiganensis]